MSVEPTVGLYVPGRPGGEGECGQGRMRWEVTHGAGYVRDAQMGNELRVELECTLTIHAAVSILDPGPIRVGAYRCQV